ncbi:pilus assembly protein TadG-related protein [Rhizobium sp. SG2393]|uniref:vWA domain-containing protein n=1 Tax=Rhizobium sp. SG2393 TaxID=3276279 RepID=UPI0036716E2F
MMRVRTLSKLRCLLMNRRGNFGMLGALTLPVLIGAGGVAMDMATMVMTKHELQDAVDAAALAGASAMAGKGVSEDEAKKIVLNYLKGQLSGSSMEKDKSKGTTPEEVASNAVVTIATKATTGNAKEYTIDVLAGRTVYFTPLTGLFGQNSTDIKTAGTATASTESKNAISMYLVLDRSGSMDEKTQTETTRTYTYDCGSKWSPKTCTGTYADYYTKMEALKMAVADLLSTLDNADPTATLVRTGGNSYNSKADTPTNLKWGTKSVKSYVDALVPSGTTNSAPAFVNAYNALMKTSENAVHKAKNGQVPSKFIVLLTDGENNVANADSTTKTYCDMARKEKIEVYSIPFMAPKAGQDLLRYCATSDAHYIPAENADQLSAAFKFIGERATALATRLSK